MTNMQPRNSKINLKSTQLERFFTLTGDPDIDPGIYKIMKYLKQKQILSDYKSLTKEEQRKFQGWVSFFENYGTWVFNFSCF